jgi:putative tricarboxylic transport membrane protein
MMKADGNLLGFFERPIAAVLGVITLGVWAWVIVGWIRSVAGGRRTPLGAEPAD